MLIFLRAGMEYDATDEEIEKLKTLKGLPKEQLFHDIIKKADVSGETYIPVLDCEPYYSFDEEIDCIL